MAPIDLHYSRAKLVRLALMSLAGSAIMVWIAAGGIRPGGELHGRGAWLGRMLGPEGLQMLGWALAAVAAAMALLYLRRAFADPVAASADGDGVTLNTLFGRHRYALDDIERFELRRPAGQPILQIIPAAGRGKTRGLAVNGLVESEDGVEAWIEAVSLRRGVT